MWNEKAPLFITYDLGTELGEKKKPISIFKNSKRNSEVNSSEEGLNTLRYLDALQ